MNIEKQRLSKVDLKQKMQNVIDGLEENFEESLTQILDLVVWNHNKKDQHTIWTKILNEMYLTEMSDDEGQDDVLNRVDLDDLEEKVKNNIKTDFELHAAFAVGDLLKGIATRNKLKVDIAATKLSCIFGIDMEEVLTRPELNVACGIMMGEL